jgi:hypothetical protein
MFRIMHSSHFKSICTFRCNVKVLFERFVELKTGGGATRILVESPLTFPAREAEVEVSLKFPNKF